MITHRARSITPHALVRMVPWCATRYLYLELDTRYSARRSAVISVSVSDSRRYFIFAFPGPLARPVAEAGRVPAGAGSTPAGSGTIPAPVDEDVIATCARGSDARIVSSDTAIYTEPQNSYTENSNCNSSRYEARIRPGPRTRPARGRTRGGDSSRGGDRKSVLPRYIKC
jgi:hypothetical protein